MLDHLDMSVDKFNLDEECVKQVRLMDHWIKASIEAVERKTEAKRNYELRKAELEMDIRNDPETYSITKVTEGAVSCAVIANIESEAAELASAEAEAYKCIQMKENVLARGLELRNLINLYLNDYFVRGSIASTEHDATEVTQKLINTQQAKPLAEKIIKAQERRRKAAQ